MITKLQENLKHILCVVYLIALYYFTLLVILSRRRLCTKFNVHYILFWMLYYLFSIFVIGLAGLGFAQQAMAGVIIGFRLWRFRDFSIIGVTGSIACGKSTFVQQL